MFSGVVVVPDDTGAAAAGVDAPSVVAVAVQRRIGAVGREAAGASVR